VVKLPILSGKELITILKKAEFQIVRQKGDYKTVVPLYSDLAKGTLLGILKQCGLSKENLVDLIKKR
jgi:predicted RNA binding protein YcfA (HicA-like mRNA interferase family)